MKVSRRVYNRLEIIEHTLTLLFVLSIIGVLPDTPLLSAQPVRTVAFSMRCLKEAVCISAVHSVATSSAVAATTLSIP